MTTNAVRLTLDHFWGICDWLSAHAPARVRRIDREVLDCQESPVRRPTPLELLELKSKSADATWYHGGFYVREHDPVTPAHEEVAIRFNCRDDPNNVDYFVTLVLEPGTLAMIPPQYRTA